MKRGIGILLTILLVTGIAGCGGGGSASRQASDSDTSSGNADAPAVLNQTMKAYTQTISDVQRQLIDGIGLLSDNFTHEVDMDTMTVHQANAFYEKLDTIEPEAIRLILLENRIAENVQALTQTDLHEGNLNAPRFLITGGVVVTATLISYIGYKLYHYGEDSKRKLYESTEYLIENTNENSALMNDIKRTIGLPKNTSKNEVLQHFRTLKSGKEKTARDLFDMAEADHPLDAEDALLYHKANVEAVAYEGADTAIKSVGAAYIAVGTSGSAVASANTRTMVNIQRALPYADIPNTTGVRLILTSAEAASAGAGAVAGAAGAAAVAVTGKEKKELVIPEPETQMSDEAAIKILEKSTESLPDESAAEDVSDAVKIIVRRYAHRSGGEDQSDGSTRIDIPERTQIIYVENPQKSNPVEIEKSDDADVVVIPENGKIVTIPDAALNQDGIIIEIPQQNETANLHVHATKIASDEGSITYRVTASLTGITGPTSVSIQVSNAATGSSTKSLSKDGSISWNVTVLEKDGSATVTRSDTHESVSLLLKGAAPDTHLLKGTLTGSWSGTDGEDDRVSGGFVMHISAGGTVSGSFNGDSEGDLSGTVSSNGDINAKSGGGGAGSGHWSGTVRRNEDGSLYGSGSWSAEGYSGGWSGSGS